VKSGADIDKRRTHFSVDVGTGGHGAAGHFNTQEINLACTVWLEKRGLRTAQEMASSERMTRINQERRARL
jgi:hypothetical protein